MAIELPRYIARAEPGVATPSLDQAYRPLAAQQQVVGAVAKEITDYSIAVVQAEDVVNARKATNEQQQRVAAFRLDPRWEQETIDGKPTEEVMRLEWEELTRELSGKDPGIRGRSKRTEYEVETAGYLGRMGVEVQADAEKRRLKTLTSTGVAGFNDALELGDFEGAAMYMDELAPYLGAEAVSQMNAKFQAEVKRTQATGIANDIRDQFIAEGEAAGQKALDSLRTNTDLPQDVRDAAITQAERYAADYEAAGAAERERLATQARVAYENDELLAMDGKLSREAIEAYSRQGKYGEEGINEERRNSLIRIAESVGEQMRRARDSLSVYNSLNRPIPKDDKAIVKAQDQMFMARTQNMNLEDTAIVAGEMARTNGYVPDSMTSWLQANANTQDSLAAAASAYAVITDRSTGNPAAYMSLGDKKAEARLEYAAQMIRAGQSPGLAAEAAFSAVTGDAAVLDVRKKEWENTVSTQASGQLAEAFEDLPGFTEAQIPAQMTDDYLALYKANYVATGDAKVAEKWARDALQRNWTLVRDLNKGVEVDGGELPKATYMRNVPKGTSGEEVRLQLIEDIKGQTFRVKDPVTDRMTTIEVDPAMVEFREPLEGSYFRLYHNGVPLVGADGRVAEFEFDAERALTDAKYDEVTKSIAKWREKRDAMLARERVAKASGGAVGGPLDAHERDRRIRIEQNLSRLEKELAQPNLDPARSRAEARTQAKAQLTAAQQRADLKASERARGTGRATFAAGV
jgi:hypothetical protein